MAGAPTSLATTLKTRSTLAASAATPAPVTTSQSRGRAAAASSRSSAAAASSRSRPTRPSPPGCFPSRRPPAASLRCSPRSSRAGSCRPAPAMPKWSTRSCERPLPRRRPRAAAPGRGHSPCPCLARWSDAAAAWETTPARVPSPWAGGMPGAGVASTRGARPAQHARI
ncbi:hypothetical protein EMIHUDRAFT_471656 [Emiliania huxleyi CCMP1516]|uniref:Uncharacterized protein n=2 Tax=Emiliania huxleyi TaxID=2903 RepID=A0A0D3K3W2_EMIH1|nr:hypothetical protein EMIHUDRAFT_471656 [Emiliania huxleyi CCMP1516]EOD30447.1 hypothetical protein EMIHUDRAFT_471656 [Emiliania huxleyi CCMP1516]|eukprot:XP_005782876.1 hypothetical protein EMIHUDRAFT_471656 [Emiliania huxleyi CCMP1516]